MGVDCNAYKQRHRSYGRHRVLLFSPRFMPEVWLHPLIIDQINAIANPRYRFQWSRSAVSVRQTFHQLQCSRSIHVSDSSELAVIMSTDSSSACPKWSESLQKRSTYYEGYVDDLESKHTAEIQLHLGVLAALLRLSGQTTRKT